MESLELLSSDQITSLQEVIGRFMLHDAERSVDDQQNDSPTANVLVRGDILGMLHDFPQLDIYTATRQEFVDAARTSGPRHSA